MMRLRVVALALSVLFATPVQAQYFVDGANGSDAAPGNASAPWATLDHARLHAPAGSSVGVLTGTYPAFTESAVPAHRTDWVTFTAIGDVVLSGIRLSYPAPRNAYLRFERFDILGSAASVVKIDQARYVELALNQIRGTQWWINNAQGRNGVDIDRSRDIRIGELRSSSLAASGNWIHEVHRGVQVNRSTHVSLLGNYIQPKAGTGIQWLDNNVGGVIRSNHIAGDTPNGNPVLAASAHASIISIRSSGVTISGNQLHGMGSTSGIMTYTPDAAGGESSYNNITIENNALYDTHPQALRFYNLGTHVVVRNNLIAPRYRKATSAAVQCAPLDRDGVGVVRDNRYRHYVALAVHDTAPAYGLELHNNVFIGAVIVPAANVQDRSNITWSMARGGAWVPAGYNAATGSEILHATHGSGCGTHDTRFEDGSFFRGAAINYHFPGTPLYNWRLAATSPALGFGNPALDPDDSLGTVHGSGTFLLLDGPARDSTHHSAGPAER